MGLVKKCRHDRRKWVQCDCAWYADYRVGGGRTYRNLGTDRRIAEQDYRLLMGRISSGVAAVAAPPLDAGMKVLSERWLSTLGDRAISTQANRRYQMIRVLKWFGDDTLPHSITVQHVLEFEAALAGQWGYSAASIRETRIALAMFLKWAEVPRLDLPRLMSDRRTAFCYQPADVRAILVHAVEWASAYRFTWLTGLRAGELRGLRSSDVSLDPPAHVRITKQLLDTGRESPPKTRRSNRIVHLSSEAVSCIPDVRAGDRLWDAAYSTLLVHWHEAQEAAGYVPRGLHVLRHSNVALRLAAGQPLTYIAEQLGHATGGFTLKAYGHLVPSSAGSAHALDSFLGSSSEA